MAINRSQFPELMGYQEGGDVTNIFDYQAPELDPNVMDFANTDLSPLAVTPEETQATDNTMQELLKALTENNFQADVDKYTQRLQSVAPPSRQPDFYDLASDLGRALLSAPPDAGAFRGIGIGLTNFNDRVKNQIDSSEKERRAVAMKAMELALEDERKADDLLQEYFLKNYGTLSEDPELITLQYEEIDADGSLTGNRITKSFDKTTEAKKIREILQNQSGVVVSDLPDSPGETKLDDKAATDLIKDVTNIDTEGAQGHSKLDAIQKAKVLATDIGKDGFGAQNSFILPIQQFLLGVLPKEAATFIDPDAKVAPKEALAAISIVFTLANVAQTKGAISNAEMNLFQRAAPFLGQTYEGFMLSLEIQEQAAKKKIQFASEYNAEYQKMITDNPDIRGAKIASHMNNWKSKWRSDNRDSFITDEQKKKITQYEKEAKQAGIRGDYTNYDSYLDRYNKAMKSDRDRNLDLANQAITQSLGPTGTMKKNLITAGIDKNTVDRMTDEQTKEMHERVYGTSL